MTKKKRSSIIIRGVGGYTKGVYVVCGKLIRIVLTILRRRQMHVHESSVSCGVKQVFDLYLTSRDMEKRIKEITDQKNHAFLVFSDTTRKTNGGHRLAAVIRKMYGEHTIYETEEELNPNSGNKIKVWVFQPNRPKPQPKVGLV